ncbi:MAG TPA: iron-containing alcohol dehydrogenase, partial [Rectinemataceae bacterium]
MKHVVRWMYFNLAGRALTIVPQKVPTLLTGPGSLKLVPSELKTLGASKPLIITDATLVKAGLSAKLEEILSGAGFAYSVYDGVLPDPSFDICSQALGVLKSSSCDSVIALGGGSVIDTAKIVRMGATHSKPLERFSGLLTCRNSGLPFIAVPTTAGTGSEATAAAVITDLKRHRKITALDPKMPPNTAILDPVL